MKTDVFAVFSLNNKICSVVRNTYHSPASYFIMFLFIKMKEISLYSFLKVVIIEFRKLVSN